VRALAKRGRAHALAPFRDQLTRLAQRLLGQFGQRVTEARGGAQGGRAQVKRQAKLFGDLAVLDIQLDQGFDLI
jgi:hypothetical protein